ncbi:acyl-CoA dehydrogenase [Kitasatospora sp. NPDC097643]|uniref:acyl-CoA dehydrogenase family protein n=1 Tax=Kitasatospora sp. NPDC097643 TaxID=3157230 RepID=UPI00331B0C4A
MDHPSRRLAERLEQRLGDPNDERRPFSLAAALRLDASDEFPAAPCRELDAVGLSDYYVPARHGGRLRSFEELMTTLRVAARRDLTTALVHHATFLGAAPVWIGGAPETAARLAGRVRDGDVVAFAVTEADHGSDLLAGTTCATATAGGYRLDGEKWLINNATRSRLVCVLARTDPAGGARGFSLFLVDKQELADGEYACLPAVRTVGVRGADISGIRFTGAEVPRAALIGDLGAGLEITLKSFQLTRTLCAGFTLGAADRGLRLAMARAERLGQTGQPDVRRVLAEAYADLLTAETVGLLAVRSAHTLPDELSVTAAVTKHLVPMLGDGLLGALGRLGGGWVDGPDQDVFEKVERDHRIIGIFDGSSAVNLASLVNQFGFLSRAYRRGVAGGVAGGVLAGAELSTPVPDFEPDRLELVSRNGSSVLNHLPAALDRLTRRAGPGSELSRRAAQLRSAVDEVHDAMGAHRPTPRDVPATAFALAERYALCFAAAACVQVWLANPAAADGWLEGVLGRLVQRLGAPSQDDPGSAVDRLFPLLERQYREHLLFSPFPARLAEGSA